MNKTCYIGLDVHKETIAIAYTTEGSRKEATYHGSCGGSNPAAEGALRKLAKKLEVKFKDLKVCYEAGPTGFVLARRLVQLGLDCVVMSPSKTKRNVIVEVAPACNLRIQIHSTGGSELGPAPTGAYHDLFAVDLVELAY